MAEKTAFLFHGSGGGPDYEATLPANEPHCLQRIEDDFVAMGIRVIHAQFPIHDQTPQAWYERFEELRRSNGLEIDENIIFAGHSLGGTLAALLAQDLATKGLHVGHTSIVAAPFGIGEINGGGYDITAFMNWARDGLHWDQVRQGAGNVRLYYSNDDPHVPIENGEAAAMGLGVKLEVLPGRKHFGANSQHQIPELARNLTIDLEPLTRPFRLEAS